MFFRRRKEEDAGRPTDDGFLAMLRDRLDAEGPSLLGQTSIRKGVMISGEGRPWAVMMLPNHADHPNHYDIGFTPSLNDPGQRIIVDCVQGLGNPARGAADAVHIWRETSGACFLEMLTQQGHHAAHLPGDHPAGIAGWHTVASGVIAYGPDDESNHQLQAAMLENLVMQRLSERIVPLLDRDLPNGIKFLLAIGADASIVAEVRVNNTPDADASEQLAEFPWPQLSQGAITRCFAVALHPDR